MSKLSTRARSLDHVQVEPDQAKVDLGKPAAQRNHELVHVGKARKQNRRNVVTLYVQSGLGEERGRVG